METWITRFKKNKQTINSMYFRPYHLKRKSNFIQFITENIIPHEKKDHPVNINSYEKKNLFQIRYKKLKKYLKLFETHNCILFSLNFVQQQPKKVIDIINQHFNIKIIERFSPILKHTKIDKYIQNDMSHQKYKISSEIYKKYANNKLEIEVNNLTYKINKI